MGDASRLSGQNPMTSQKQLLEEGHERKKKES